MKEPVRKTSMAVMEMGRRLGLGKTDAYWLVKKKYFDTVLVAGKMRIMIDSFEDWYAHQYTYRKVDGEAPGGAYAGVLLSVADIAGILGLAEATAAELVAKAGFECRDIYGKRRYLKTSFDSWYAAQSDYLSVDDRERLSHIRGDTISIPDAARMLGISRNQMYYLVSRGHFDMVQFGRRKRMTKESFERWYAAQSHYRKVSDGEGDFGVDGKETDDGIDH